MPIASKKDSSKLKYVRLINQSVHTSDDIDIGDIFAVSKNIIVVVRGYINVHYYYIPIDKVEGWDGKVLWLNITEQQVKNYERHDAYPDSSEYFVNDSPPFDKIPPDFQSHYISHPRIEGQLLKLLPLLRLRTQTWLNL